MLKDALTLSALIAAVLLVRAAFKNRVPKRLLYALWLVVLLKLCLPGTAYALPLLPAEQTAAVQQTEAPAQSAPAAQQPAQAAAQPQTPAQQPASQPQEAAKPAAAMPLVTEPVLVIWFCGSVLLGLWLLLTWLVFTVRLRRSRRFLGRRGRVRIYAAGSISSPCLAGLIPAVYLTEDVVQTDAAELVLRHELTHLRHLDPLWSFCRAAAVTVYWWNPFVWLAAFVSGRDAELACDEAVAAKLSPAQRVAYARAILAQAPRKTAALSLAGPPVKERIVFLTRKQRTSVLCVVLALLLTVTATGCSFAELTARGEDPEAVHQEALKSVLKTDVSLTQEQIDAVNAVFADYELSTDDTLGHFAVNGFFTSTYDDVRELNLKVGTVVNRAVLGLRSRLDQKLEYYPLIRSFGSYPHADGIQVMLLRAGEEMAHALALEVGDEVICIKKRILADTTPVIYSIDYLPRSLFGNRDYTRIDLTGDIFEILEQECHQQISSNVAHLKASCGDEAIRAAMRLAPGEAMLLLDEVCFNRLCRPVMRSLSYYTNFFDFSILRKLL